VTTSNPRIQYATTVDGVRIAYWAVGSGPPLVYMGGWPFEHVSLEWHQPDYRLLYDHLSEQRTLIRFDGRGTGLSDRDVPTLSIESRMLDLQAVVDGLNLERFALIGFTTSSPVAIAYTAYRPEAISELVLYDAHADATAIIDTPQMQAFAAMLDANWELFTEMLSNVGYGWSAGEPARRFAAFLRECVSRSMAKRAFEHMRTLDVSPLLPKIGCPTLVLQHADLPYSGLETARALAMAIHGASLVTLEGNYGNHTAPERHAILEFLGVEHDHRETAESMLTVMFTDMQDSTGVTHRLGDEAAQEIVRAHNAIVRAALVIHHGTEIKHTGDGLMASFVSPARALACAIDVQQRIARHNETAAIPIRLRIGMNAGEPIAEENDLFGTPVQVASRVCSHAEPEQILVSDVVRQLVAGKGFLFADQGDVVLRGLEDPTRLFEVLWRTA
jgi:class 3 adenylate cyclase